MKIEQVSCGPLDVNCYIVWSEDRKDCVLIDPAGAEPVRKRLEELGLCCTHILLTHGHFDHIGGVAKIKEATGAAVCIHEDDVNMLQNENASLAAVMGAHVDPCEADVLLHHGDTVAAAGLTFQVLHTPGHTPGGVCYVCERALFSGDCLFRLSVGRTDFPGSDAGTLYHAIVERLFTLPGDYQVYPGHLRETTLEFERAHNPFVRREKGELW